MTPHVDDDLVALVSGELSREETRAVARHLRDCEHCRLELVEVAVGHGSLTAAASAEAELRRRPATGAPSPWGDPPAPAPPGDQPAGSAWRDQPGPSPWGDDALPPRWVHQPASPPRADQPGGPARGDHPVPGSVASAVGGSPGGPRRQEGRRRTRIWGAAAAVALMAVGATAGIALSRSSHRPAVAAVATLYAIAAPQGASGSVTVRSVGVTEEMAIATLGLPQPKANQFYEVWLLQPATNKMLPLGVLAPSGAGQYEVAAPIMAEFTAIDVSLQANDGNPAHSRTSVLRGLVHRQAR